MKRRPVSDVSHLPDYGFGPRMTMFWGTLGFCLLEGAGFAIAAGVYLYLRLANARWPLGAAPPGLVWSSALTILLAVSLIPNQVVKKLATREDLRGVRFYLIVMSAVAVAALALRAMEFTTLGVTWDQNAYGSAVWMLLGLHTVHILTDAVDTWVLTAVFFTRHVTGIRFSDAEDNAFYWIFVVLSWAPIYALLYWAPRM